MKEDLQSKMVEILTSIQTAAGKASDFAMDQLPDIAQSYVAYGRVVTTATSAFLLLLSIAAAWVGIWAYRNPWNTSYWAHERHLERSDSNQIVIFFGGLVSVCCLISAVATFNWLVWIAPKVWLLKELASLIK